MLRSPLSLVCGLGCLALAPSLVSAQKGPPVAAAHIPMGDYVMEDAFPGLQFSQPLAFAQVPGDKSRLFIVEKTGKIQVITKLDGGQPVKEEFLDFTQPADGPLETAGECGLLGLAFPPDHARNGRFFIYYSIKIDGKLHQRVSRFEIVAGQPNRADKSTEQPLWSQEDPAGNHNGGDVQFGPDGHLYVSLGDGGGGGDPFDRARFIDKDFHGAILRMDVNPRPDSLPPNPHPGIARSASGEAFYAIPKDNPFVGKTSHHGRAIDPKTVRTEIYATGLRNPWRMAFDVPTGRFFTGDVGQNLYEEVNLIVAGGDYGWSHREATHAFTTGPGKDEEPGAFTPIEPIYEYPRTVGVSITGGVVYRENKLSELKGAYLFADYGTGVVMALHEDGGKWKDEVVAREPAIAGIGHDPRDGEVLFASLASGKLTRLSKKPAATAVR